MEKRTFFSYGKNLKLCKRALSFAVTLREEGEVAWLESPNGLGATAELQIRGEGSRTKFPAIHCRRSASLRNEQTDKPLFAVCPRTRANKCLRCFRPPAIDC